MLLMMQEWGTPPPHQTDYEPDCGDGEVNILDWNDLFFHWGACPGASGGGSAPGEGGSEGGLTLEEALWLIGFSSSQDYLAWLAQATDEQAYESVVMLAALLGG